MTVRFLNILRERLPSSQDASFQLTILFPFFTQINRLFCAINRLAPLIYSRARIRLGVVDLELSVMNSTLETKHATEQTRCVFYSGTTLDEFNCMKF